MKEKIGIEKLIELLNEYGNEICNHWGDYQTDMDFTDRDTYWYLSKKFGWIGWLVENDKIDFNKDAFVSLSSELGCSAYDEKIVLMVLSISDTPIEDLISYLK